MSQIQYLYAFDDTDKKIVCINDFNTKDEAKKHSFSCISCGRELLSRAIESHKMSSHFYHKEDNCSKESYLHKLGKILIKKMFYTQDEFIISFSKTLICDRMNLCKLSNNISCSTLATNKRINLKEFYDICEEESKVDNFVADLLLKSSKNKNLPPILIEIYVTHKSEEQKINSGHRIIEIKIENETDIHSIIIQNQIKESENIKFYNFNNTEKINLKGISAKFNIYCLYEDVKNIIKDKFNSSKSLYIGYNKDTLCKDIETCRFANLNFCKKEGIKIDLKKYYSTYEEDVYIDGFVAPLLLKNSNNPKIEPLIIDISYNNIQCQNKQIYKHKTIEIKIEYKGEIYHIFNQNNIKESKNIIFHNFRRKLYEPFERYISRYVQKNNNSLGFITEIICKNANYRLYKDSIIELNFASTLIKNTPKNIMTPLSWMKKYKNYKNCILCSEYENGDCRLSGVHGLKESIEIYNPEKCYYYNPYHFSEFLNNMEIEEVHNTGNNIKEIYNIAIIGSFINNKNSFEYFIKKRKENFNIFILCGSANYYIIKEFTDKNKIKIIKYDSGLAMYSSNKNMINDADELLVFNNAHPMYIDELEFLAQKKGIPITNIDTK